jgi:hypothetical protein
MPLNYSKSWLQFLSKVEQAKEEIGFKDGKEGYKSTQECFYRGHTHTSYRLIPGLLRGLDKTVKKIPKLLGDIESDLYYEFRSKAKDLHNQSVSDWDILIFMQHHGVRTRLLDWSDSLGVAIYFSLCNYNPAKSKPCIWIMNPYKLNYEYHDSWD